MLEASGGMVEWASVVSTVSIAGSYTPAALIALISSRTRRVRPGHPLRSLRSGTSTCIGFVSRRMQNVPAHQSGSFPRQVPERRDTARIGVVS